MGVYVNYARVAVKKDLAAELLQRFSREDLVEDGWYIKENDSGLFLDWESEKWHEGESKVENYLLDLPKEQDKNFLFVLNTEYDIAIMGQWFDNPEFSAEFSAKFSKPKELFGDAYTFLVKHCGKEEADAFVQQFLDEKEALAKSVENQDAQTPAAPSL